MPITDATDLGRIATTEINAALHAVPRENSGNDAAFRRILGGVAVNAGALSPQMPVKSIQTYFNELNAHVTRTTADLPVRKTIRDYLREALTAPLQAVAPPPTAGLQGPIGNIIAEAGKKFGIPSRLIEAVAHTESRFNPHAVSRAGAKGVMQLMDPTARAVGVQNSFDARQNIFGGAEYLKRMLDKYHHNIPLALAAYNAGPAAVDRHGGIPPYAETRNYINRVMNYFTAGV